MDMFQDSFHFHHSEQHQRPQTPRSRGQTPNSFGGESVFGMIPPPALHHFPFHSSLHRNTTPMLTADSGGLSSHVPSNYLHPQQFFGDNHLSSKYGLNNDNASFKQMTDYPNQEFLPICDSLFNILSLAIYFCDVVFDLLTIYTWYSTSTAEFYEGALPRKLMFHWSLLGLVFTALSFTISQCLSFKWYKESARRKEKSPETPPSTSGALFFIHLSFVSVFWRYFKLFIPVDLRFVKNDVRDLCILRLVHAFCQAGPMQLLQLYLIWHEPGLEYVSDLTKVSTIFSLVSICWALASFSKYIQSENVQKLVLTWLGVISQFLWRLGTVTSRFIALSLYAVVYQYWVLVVIFLHFISMLLWLLSQNTSSIKKLSYSVIIAVVYTVCYVNFEESNSKTRIVIYYVTMFLENTLLLGVWLIAKRYEDEIWFRSTVTYAVFFCFFGGVAFMAVYYQYFHVNKLSYEDPSIDGSLINYDLPTSDKTGYVGKNKKKVSAISHQPQFKSNQNGHPNVPGVFNCRFHPVMKKKKKPTTFIPPPSVSANANEVSLSSSSQLQAAAVEATIRHHENFLRALHHNDYDDGSFTAHYDLPEYNGPTGMIVGESSASSAYGPIVPGYTGTISPPTAGRMMVPFWRRPLSIMGSENEGSVCSRVDIYQKLQEKKQHQLAELKKIDEEIKQGILAKPELHGINPEPVPVEKKQPWFREDDQSSMLTPGQEILLDPQHYFVGSAPMNIFETGYYPEWPPSTPNYYEPVYQNRNERSYEDGVRDSGTPPSCSASGGEYKSRFGDRRRRKGHGPREGIYKSYRIPSDIDSQMSIPRSYTLPSNYKKKRKSVNTSHINRQPKKIPETKL